MNSDSADLFELDLTPASVVSIEFDQPINLAGCSDQIDAQLYLIDTLKKQLNQSLVSSVSTSPASSPQKPPSAATHPPHPAAPNSSSQSERSSQSKDLKVTDKLAKWLKLRKK
jgi:hypothetical protein